MKKIIGLFLLMPFFGLSQSISYKEQGDTLIINGKQLLPNDTVHLGMGSAIDKSFLFIWQKPTKKSIIFSSNGNFSPSYLQNYFCNTYLIYKGKVNEGDKKNILMTPIFYLLGSEKLQYNLSFQNAIQTGELRGF